jgi:hypothetical protein
MVATVAVAAAVEVVGGGTSYMGAPIPLAAPNTIVC